MVANKFLHCWWHQISLPKAHQVAQTSGTFFLQLVALQKECLDSIEIEKLIGKILSKHVKSIRTANYS
jgi:hypothetical protein